MTTEAMVMSAADFSTRPLASLDMTEEPFEMTEEAFVMTEEPLEMTEDVEAIVDLSFRPTGGSGEIYSEIHEYTAATAIPIHTEKK